MEIPNLFVKYIREVFEYGSLGLSLMEIIILIFSFIIALIIRGLFATIVVSKIKKIVQKTGNLIDDQVFDSLAPPLKLLPLLFVFILTGLLIDNDSKLVFVIEKINRTFVTIFIFWLLHQSLVPLSYAFQKLEELLSKSLVIWLIRSLKYLIIFLGGVAVLETWGIYIGPIIAGLGLFGVAVALGAHDLFSNLIIVEKRLQV